MRETGRERATLALMFIAAAVFALGQGPPAQPARGGRGRGGGGGAPAYPSKAPADPASLERGKTIYSTNCAFCHGDDARGGEEGGPNLIRSEVLLRDQKGELLAPVLQSGRPPVMPKFALDNQQVADIAAFIHSFGINSRDPARQRPPSIVVGNARDGEVYFQSKCGSCHSAAGDLKGIATRISDPRSLQQAWLMPAVPGGRGGGGAALNVPPTTVAVTLADGQKVEGRLGRIDDFIVTLTQADGTPRTFRRDGDDPKVEIHDPIKPHKDLLRVYSDKDIHDVTAYLVTLK